MQSLKTTLYILILVGVASILGVGIVWLYSNWQSQALAGANADSCAVTTVSASVVGDDLSSTVLARNSNRAWAQIELPVTSAGIATNTVALSFDEGAVAVLGSGLTLSTTTTLTKEFGLQTPFPYTGAVTGITNTASTTVRVTECSF